jgi:hypothetical protein
MSDDLANQRSHFRPTILTKKSIELKPAVAWIFTISMTAVIKLKPVSLISAAC